MADEFDMSKYPVATIQFGPSIVVRNRWFSLGSLEQIIQDEKGMILCWKSGSTCILDKEDAALFHAAMIAGAKQIESQIQQQQAQQAGMIAKQLGIIRPS